MKRAGCLTVICGSMFAGKSEELIRLIRRSTYARKQVQAFKHAYDKRYAESHIATHEGVKLHAVPVSSSREIEQALDRKTEVVAVEEAQFFDDALPELCVRLADSGKTVLVAGLDQDFRRRPFGPMGDLLVVADEVVKLRAICMRCGDLASHTQRIINGKPASYHDPVVLVGAAESYEARCRNCHELPDAPGGRKSTPRRSRTKPDVPEAQAALLD